MADWVLNKWWQKLMYVVGYILVIFYVVALVVGLIIGATSF